MTYEQAGEILNAADITYYLQKNGIHNIYFHQQKNYCAIAWYFLSTDSLTICPNVPLKTIEAITTICQYKKHDL